PNGSQPTNEMIAEWVGYTTVIEKNVSKSVQRQGWFGGSSVTTQTSQSNTKRHLIMPDEIATMGDMTIIYIVGKGPIKGTAYRYYEDKEILKRTDLPIPQQLYVPSKINTNSHTPTKPASSIEDSSTAIIKQSDTAGIINNELA